jgi:hypothetical protein
MKRRAMSAGTSTASRFARVLARKGMNTKRVSQSTLVLAQPIIAGNSTYTFPVLQNQAPVLPNEIRLSLQDLFEVTTLSVGFSGLVTFAGPPILSLRRNFFAPLVGLNPLFLPMYAMYGGTLKCVINEVSYLLNWDLNRHLSEGTSQINQFSAGVPTTFTEVEGNKTGFFPVNPGIVLNGQAKNDFTIQMPTNQLAPIAPQVFTTQTGAVTIEIDQIVMILRGNLAQNASGNN